MGSLARCRKAPAIGRLYFSVISYTRSAIQCFRRRSSAMALSCTVHGAAGGITSVD